MEPIFDYIIPPVDKELIRAELNSNTFIRNTNKGNNEIYIINHHNSPNVMREIGRLREVTFAAAGGGTGLELDVDDFDLSNNCYEQLIVFSPEFDEIIGGYRFIDCSKILDTDPIELSTAHYFHLNANFKKEYLPYTIELGRSWVRPMFQPSNSNRKGIYALDNLWDGLGAITVDYPHIKHFFGKVTMYSSYHVEARDAVLGFMKYFFEDKEHLVTPIYPLDHKTDIAHFLKEVNGLDFKSAIKVLSKYVMERGEFIPPLINSYMGLSPTMKMFGTAMNNDFGGVEETGILVTIADIYEEKKSRHINTYVRG